MAEFDRKASEQIKYLEEELVRLTAERRLVEAKISGLKMYLLATKPVEDLGNDAGVMMMEEQQGGRRLLFLPQPRPGVKEQILRAAELRLSDGSSMRTADLVHMLAEQGIDIGGKDPIASVSSILSRDDRFQASRKTGWSLKKESPAEDGALDLQPMP